MRFNTNDETGETFADALTRKLNEKHFHYFPQNFTVALNRTDLAANLRAAIQDNAHQGTGNKEN